MAMSGGVMGAAALRPGSLRLIVLRWLLAVAAALPGVAVAYGVLAEEVGRRPYFAEAGDPLPFFRLTAALGEVGPGWVALAAGAGLAWLGGLLLTAGAVETLDPARGAAPPRVWRAAVDTGTRFLWAYLRVALLAALGLAAGGRLVVLLFQRLGEHAQRVGWTGATILLTLPLLRVVALLAWASVVGAAAWWLRVILVADGRRRVRRLPGAVLRVWWRCPLQALAFHWVLAVGSVLSGAVVLFAWRQSAAATGGWVALWLTVLLLQAFLWHWRLRACLVVWEDPRAEDLRRRPDEPWHLLRRLRRRRAVAPPATPSTLPAAGMPAAAPGPTAPDEAGGAPSGAPARSGAPGGPGPAAGGTGPPDGDPAPDDGDAGERGS